LDSIGGYSLGESIHPVKRLEPNRLFLESGEVEEFDWVFDTRGLGAKEYFRDLRGVRG